MRRSASHRSGRFVLDRARPVVPVRSAPDHRSVKESTKRRAGRPLQCFWQDDRTHFATGSEGVSLAISQSG